MGFSDLIYRLGLRDEMSHKLDHANERAEIFHKTLERVESYAEIFGVVWGAEKVVEYFKEAGEEAHNLEKAELNLANTMQTMGTYSDEAKEKTSAWAEKLMDTTGIHEDRLIKLAANMELVSGVDEKMAQRGIKSSADWAAKRGVDIETVAATLQRSLIDPSQLGRAAKLFNIGEGEKEKIEALAHIGKIREAREELLSYVESKGGNFAETAFNLDPLGKFNETMYKSELAVGHYVEKIKGALAPALEKVAHWFKDSIDWLGKHQELVKGVAYVAGSLAIAFTAVAAAEATWTAAQWLLDAALEANPISLIATAAVALVGAIIWIANETEGWGETWNNTINYVTAVWTDFKDNLALDYLIIRNSFDDMTDAIVTKWEQAQVLMGRMTRDKFVNDQQEMWNAFKQRRREIADMKDDIADSQDVMDKNIWAVHFKTESKESKDRITQAGGGGLGATLDETGGVPKASKATGTKAITINIAINGGLVHEMKIITNTFGEAIEEIEQKVANVLLRAVNDASLHTAI